MPRALPSRRLAAQVADAKWNFNGVRPGIASCHAVRWGYELLIDVDQYDHSQVYNSIHSTLFFAVHIPQALAVSVRLSNCDWLFAGFDADTAVNERFFN